MHRRSEGKDILRGIRKRSFRYHVTNLQIYKNQNTEEKRLRRTSSGMRLGHAGDLLASPDDTLARAVKHKVDALVLLLRAFPDLDLAAATDDTHSHGRQQVVGGVGVAVHTTVEHGSGVLADTSVDHGLATGVVLDKVGAVVHNTGNGDKATALLGFLDVLVPFHDGKLVERRAPVEVGTLLVELLLLLLETALFDLVGAELLQVVGEAKLLPGPDGPLGRVVLPPLDGVAVVGWELVVEVVVALTHGDESSEHVVTRGIAVVERLIAEPVSQGVDAEGGLLDEEDAENTSVDESTEPVTPAESRNETRQSEAHGDEDAEVVLVLPDNDGILVQIGDVGAALALGVLFHDHPSDVGVHEALADGVGVLFGIGVPMVSTVATSPPSNGAFDGATANGSEIEAKRQASRVRTMGPETMIS